MSDTTTGRGNRGGGRSGRGSGRSGRGGRGRGNSHYKGHNPNRKPKPKSVEDYMYYLGSAKQASDYETTTEFLINHIKGEFHYGEDIGNALSALEPYDMEQHEPSLRVSTSADDEVKAAQN